MIGGGPVGPGGGPRKDTEVGFSMEAMHLNMRQLMTLRTITFIAGGIICGILGLTGWLGAVFYIVLSVIAAVSVMLVTGFNPNSYFMVSNVGLLMIDLVNFNHILSFILFWVLSYALVYIY